MRFRLRLPDQRRIDLAAAQIGVAADEAEHAAEGVGPVPGRGEGADAAGAATPAMARSFGSVERLKFLATSGRISSSRKRA